MTTCPHCKKSFTLRRSRPGTLISQLDKYVGVISAKQILQENPSLSKGNVYEFTAQLIKQGAWKKCAKRGYYIATPRKIENANAD